MISSKFSGFLSLALIATIFTSCVRESFDNIRPQGNNRLVEIGAVGSGQGCVTLIAGQSISAGALCFADSDTDGDGLPDLLLVTYETSNGWALNEVHLWLGSTLSSMPQNNNGSPKTGQFPYKASNINGSSLTFEIPFGDLNYDCSEPERFFVVAHAVVSNGNVTETAWADGERLLARGNWSMYFNIWMSCTDAPEQTASETAWAKSSELSTCFIDIADLQSNNWGWSNGPFGEGEYEFDLIAGAGQCNGGEKVGYVNVEYLGGTAQITVVMEGENFDTGIAYSLDELHIYAGSNILPSGQNGSLTTAPGQLGYNSGNITGSTSKTVTITDLSDNVYFAIHAVVSGFPL